MVLRLNHQPDRRRARRQELNQFAAVSILGTVNDAVQGEIRNVSTGGTQIRLNQPLRFGSLVAIDYDDNRLLGEVVYCLKEQDGWLVGIRVEHALSGLATLPSFREDY
jgi:hypothetical protein